MGFFPFEGGLVDAFVSSFLASQIVFLEAGGISSDIAFVLLCASGYC